MEDKLMFVITADVIRSKSHDEIENYIKKQLKNVNSKFEDVLYTKFISLKGDEFQAVIEKKNHKVLLSIIRDLRRNMGKHKLRIGIAFGLVNEAESNENLFGSWDFNGEAFFKARDAIDYLKQKKNSSVQMETYFNISKNMLLNDIINLLYYNIDNTISKWDEENWDIVEFLEKDYTHEEIANKMNSRNNSSKNRDTYTKKIQRSAWYLVQETEELIDRIILEEII